MITTRNRPQLVRRALASVIAQDYPGPLRIVVVHDGTPPDWRLADAGTHPVLVLENWRTPGPGGARNTGILAAGDCAFVAFCDDDDTWAPRKLTTQISAMRARPGTLFATCAVGVEYDGRTTVRASGGRRSMHWREMSPDRALRPDTRRLRVSGFVARQSALATDPGRGGIGLFAEDAPTPGDCWDLLIRAASRAPVLHLDTPLVRMLWRPEVFDGRRCAGQIAALRWMVRRHPELRAGRTGARVFAELAGWAAVAGNRDAARHWAGLALRTRWYEPRAVLALAATAGLVPGARLGRLLNR